MLYVSQHSLGTFSLGNERQIFCRGKKKKIKRKPKEEVLNYDTNIMLAVGSHEQSQRNLLTGEFLLLLHKPNIPDNRVPTTFALI